MRCYLCYIENIVISVMDNPDAARAWLLQRKDNPQVFVECWDASKNVRLYISDNPE